MSPSPRYLAKHPHRPDAVVGWRDVAMRRLARYSGYGFEETRMLLDGSHRAIEMLEEFAKRLNLTHDQLWGRIMRAKKLREMGEFPYELEKRLARGVGADDVHVPEL